MIGFINELKWKNKNNLSYILNDVMYDLTNQYV